VVRDHPAPNTPLSWATTAPELCSAMSGRCCGIHNLLDRCAKTSYRMPKLPLMRLRITLGRWESIRDEVV
jgi:hypothetical protein